MRAGMLLVLLVGCSRARPDKPVVASADAAPAAELVGKVMALEGQVSAQRGGSPRALAVDAPVFADDVLTTGAGASVTLLFTDSGVYSIEEGRTRPLAPVLHKLAEISALIGGPASGRDDSEDATAAAARHAEASAADTSATSKPVDEIPDRFVKIVVRSDGGTPTGQVALGEVPAPGLEKETLAVLVRGLGRVRACYQSALSQRPHLTGRLELLLTVVASGRVAMVTAAPGGTVDELLTGCLSDQLEGLRFPKPRTPSQVVRMPLVFSLAP